MLGFLTGTSGALALMTLVSAGMSSSIPDKVGFLQAAGLFTVALAILVK